MPDSPLARKRALVARGARELSRSLVIAPLERPTGPLSEERIGSPCGDCLLERVAAVATEYRVRAEAIGMSVRIYSSQLHKDYVELHGTSPTAALEVADLLNKLIAAIPALPKVVVPRRH